MSLAKKGYPIYCHGLTPEQLTKLKEIIPDNFQISPLEKLQLELDRPAGNTPIFLILPKELWKNIPSVKQGQANLVDPNDPFVLIIFPTWIQKQAKQHEPWTQHPWSIGFNFQKKEPLHLILGIINGVLEKFSKMSKEIELEREILLRKNNQLTFINDFLTAINNSLDQEYIIEQAQQEISRFIQLDGMAVLTWSLENPGQGEVFLSKTLTPDAKYQWFEFIVNLSKQSQQRQLDPKKPILNLNQLDFPACTLRPEQTLTFELSSPGKRIGLLILQSEQAFFLGADRYQTLKVAMDQLALILYNALEYAKTKKLANSDWLTRLNNRQFFDKRIQEEIKRHQRHNQELSLIILDLDHFKRINDTFGHQAGDHVLREVAKVIKNTIRESDIPARYGGEEFVIILPQTTNQQARILAERLRHNVASHQFKAEGRKISITISLGVATAKPDLFSNPKELISQADQALYQAKTKGRNISCNFNLSEGKELNLNPKARLSSQGERLQ